MEPRRLFLFHCPTSTTEEFRRFAETAAQLGATHIFISDLPKSRWQWEMDRSDPYPNWGMMHATIFKVIVPPELAEWLPADYARRNLQIVAERGQILKSLGLKAAFSGSEPAWLPEPVYRAHPEWRGARCEHPRRARHAYFSPCIDHTQVLSMYRSAVAELCRHAPVEYFSFLTNDSGGGICWSQGLYPGANGPAQCRGRSFKDRLIGFLSTIQQGAADAGLTAQVGITGSIPQTEAESAWPFLPPGQAITGRTSAGRWTVQAGSKDDFYGSNVYPVVGIPQTVRFAEQLEQTTATDTTPNVLISFPSVDSPELFDLLRQFRKQPATGIVARTALLERVAATQVGTEQARALVDAWEHIRRCVETIRHIEGGGPLLLLGCVNQRWLTRPLVPFPLELPEDRKAYYRPFQFQANTEEEAADLMDLQCYELVRGNASARLANSLLDTGLGHLRAAKSCIDTILQQTTAPEIADRLKLLSLRLQTLICIIRNAKNAITFQEVLDRTDLTQRPTETTLWHVPGDPRLRQLQEIMRSEVDNTHELIGLIESASPGALLQLAPRPGDEDTFLLSPDIVQHLQKKIAIMLDHWMDLNRLYERFS